MLSLFSLVRLAFTGSARRKFIHPDD